MGDSEGAIANRLSEVRQRIADACRAACRAPSEVTLVAVSKRQPDEAVMQAYRAGQRDFGENLVQAWRARLSALEPEAAEARWHLIGGLQTNKARLVAAGLPALVHTVDRPSLVEALERRLAGLAPLPVLLQVNVDEEPQKAGAAPQAVDELADRLAASSSLTLRGLMCIPRPCPDGPPRAAFERTRDLLTQVADRVTGEPVLSMGMSADYAAAIAEGSTLVRVGTAIFGPRRDQGLTR